MGVLTHPKEDMAEMDDLMPGTCTKEPTLKELIISPGPFCDTSSVEELPSSQKVFFCRR